MLLGRSVDFVCVSSLKQGCFANHMLGIGLLSPQTGRLSFIGLGNLCCNVMSSGVFILYGSNVFYPPPPWAPCWCGHPFTQFTQGARHVRIVYHGNDNTSTNGMRAQSIVFWACWDDCDVSQKMQKSLLKNIKPLHRFTNILHRVPAEELSLQHLANSKVMPYIIAVRQWGGGGSGNTHINIYLYIHIYCHGFSCGFGLWGFV